MNKLILILLIISFCLWLLGGLIDYITKMTLKRAIRRENRAIASAEHERWLQETKALKEAENHKYITFVTFDGDETVYMAATRYQDIQTGERVAATIDGAEKWGTIVENTKSLNYSAVNPKLLIEVKRYDDTDKAKQKKNDKLKYTIAVLLVIALSIGLACFSTNSSKTIKNNSDELRRVEDKALSICKVYEIENATAKAYSDGVDGSFKIYQLDVKGNLTKQYTKEQLYNLVMSLNNVEVNLPMAITMCDVYFDDINYSAFKDHTLYIDNKKYDLGAKERKEKEKAELEKYSALSKPEEGMPEKYIGVTGYGEPDDIYEHIGLGANDFSQYVKYYWKYSNGDYKAIATVYYCEKDTSFAYQAHRDLTENVTSVEFFKKGEKKPFKYVPSGDLTIDEDDGYGREDYGSPEDFYEDYRDEFDSYDEAEDFFEEYYDE